MRITSGRLAHCAGCRNLRLQVAIDRGFDESMVAQLDDVDGSDLTEAQKAAVRFTQAFLTDSEGSGPDALAELGRHFDDEQVAELVLDLIRLRPGSKLAVVSGNEPDHDDLVVI